MEIHNVFAHDITADDYASRMSVAIKKEQVISNEGSDFSGDVLRRGSMVNIKEFIAEVKINHIKDLSYDDGEERNESDTDNTQDDDGEENTETQEQDLPKCEQKDVMDIDKEEGTFNLIYFIAYIIILEICSEEQKVEEDTLSNTDNDKPDEEKNWFTKVRRHSFSELQEATFLMKIQNNEEMTRDQCKKLLSEGKLIEENIANIKYLIKTEALEAQQPKDQTQ
jgi:hypothetical protein